MYGHLRSISRVRAQQNDASRNIVDMEITHYLIRNFNEVSHVPIHGTRIFVLDCWLTQPTMFMMMMMMNPHSTTKQRANIATIENYIL